MNTTHIHPNNLKKERIKRGLTITALSKLSNVSGKTISQTERGLKDPTGVTKNKIVIGLNAAPATEDPLQYKDIFPNDHG